MAKYYVFNKLESGFDSTMKFGELLLIGAIKQPAPGLVKNVTCADHRVHGWRVENACSINHWWKWRSALRTLPYA